MKRLLSNRNFYACVATFLWLLMTPMSCSQTLREQLFTLGHDCGLVAPAQPPAMSTNPDVVMECAALCLEQECTVASFNVLAGTCTPYTDLVNVTGTLSSGKGYLVPNPSAAAGAPSCVCGALPVGSMCLHFLSDAEVPWETATSACTIDSLLLPSLLLAEETTSFTTFYARAMTVNTQMTFWTNVRTPSSPIVGPLSLTTTVGQGEVDSGLDITALTCGVFSINGCSGQATLILSDGVYATATDMYMINLFSDTRNPSINRLRTGSIFPESTSAPSTSPNYQNLVCGQSIAYWVRWDGDKVVVGMGQSISLNFFIEHVDNTPPSVIDHLTLRATGTGTQADWDISTCLDCEVFTISKSADGSATSTREFGDCTRDAGYVCQSLP